MSEAFRNYWALHVLLCLLLIGPASAQKAPSRKACEKSIQALLACKIPSKEATAREAAMLPLLARYPALSARDAKTWRKKIRTFHKKGRRLAAKGKRVKRGRQFFDDKRKRGLFYVGGETKRPQALLIGLHGGGKGSGDASASFGAYQNAANKLDWALICPEVLVKSELGWTTDGTEEWVLELIDCALRSWKIDPDRVYITGHSMGGYGSWSLGAHHADRIAAIAPSAGAPTPIFDIRDKHKIIDIQQGVIASLRNVRAVIFQSTDDPRVPPGPNQYAVRLLKEAKQRWGAYDFEYIEVPDRQHRFPKGGPIVLLDKIKDAKRNAVPERITWQPVLPWKRQFYWLWWDEPVLDALVVADLEREKNTIHITCSKEGKAIAAPGLRVLLDDRMIDFERDVVLTLNGKELFRGKAERRLAVLALTGRHPDTKLIFEAMLPAAGGGH